MSSDRPQEPIPGIVVYEHSVVEGKNAIVFGSAKALAVDACLTPAEAAEMVDVATARGRRLDYLAFTHGHPDHVFGSSQFQNVEVIAHREYETMVQLSIGRHAAKTGQDRAALNSSLAHPSTVFEGSVTIDLGERSIELFHTPGHSPDSICAFVHDDEVLVASDTVVTNIVPSIADGDSRQLEASLRSLAERNAELLIPGHGPVVGGRERVRESILWPADYLRAVRERILETQPQPQDDLSSIVPYREFVGNRFSIDSYRMDRRHLMVVNKISSEAVGEQLPSG